MNVTAAYKFVKTPEGLGRPPGRLQIYGFGLVPGTQGDPLRQEGIYTALQAKFGKIFGPEIKLQGFKFNNVKLAAAGQLVPQEIIAQDGWLAVGYCRQVKVGGDHCWIPYRNTFRPILAASSRV